MALNAKVTKNASKKVICENQIFNSIQECSMFYNVSYGKIAGWLRGDRKMPIEFQEKGLAYYNPKN